MTDLQVTLLTDGPSDRVLLRHLRWLLKQRLPDDVAIQMEWADLCCLRERPPGLLQKIHAALDLYPCNLLLIHRDSEGPDPSPRYEEISRATKEIGEVMPAFVCVVPVRMTEAWLLFDDRAIRLAAGNPNGREPLGVPCADVEKMPNPKQTLHDALRTAKGLSPRRLKRFRVADAVQRVAEYIDDFSPLLRLAAFDRLDKGLCEVIRNRSWNRGTDPS